MSDNEPPTATPQENARKLRQLAQQVGFDRVGIARVETPRYAEAFVRWLERGEHATMSFMERRAAERLDPSQYLDGVRSAVCVASDYFSPDFSSDRHEASGRTPSSPARWAGGDVAKGQPAGEGSTWAVGTGEVPTGDEDETIWPSVARYARGRDYHNLVGKRLKRLSRLIHLHFPGVGTRCSVDTGPVLERELAAAAGLGAVGKNTVLLHPEAGSWFFIGQVMTTLDVQPDPAVADLCGTCAACLDACPTGALPEPFRLDSNRCISYWTIEHRGSIPAEVRDSIGEWLFGCDVCQEVCPVNASPNNLPPNGGHDLQQYGVPQERRDWSLASLLETKSEEFADRFRGSALKRAGLSGLKRNAAIVMGNRARPQDVEPLTQALKDSSAVVREHAAWALGKLGDSTALAALQQLVADDDDPTVHRAAKEAIAQLEATSVD